MYFLTSKRMICEIIDSLTLQSGSEFDGRVRYLLERQLLLLVRLSKREQRVEMEGRLEKAIARQVDITNRH